MDVRRWRTRQRTEGSLGEYGGSFSRRRTFRQATSAWSFALRQKAPTTMQTLPLTESPLDIHQQNQANRASSLMAATRRRKPWYIIDPRRSVWMPIWDSLTTMCLIFTAIVTPFEVAFLTMPSTLALASTDPLFIMNRCIDATFTLDMLLQFFVMYQDRSRVDGVKWIDEPQAILSHYLTGCARALHSVVTVRVRSAGCSPPRRGLACEPSQ